MPQTGAGESADSPWARRLSTARWRDPRLLLGLLLVVVCAVVGARLLAGVDDYALVWSAKRDLPAGTHLEPADLQSQSIRFRDQSAADRYLATEQSLSGAVLSHPLGAGELVPGSALATTDVPPLDELPLGVQPEAVPVGLSQGDLVDVWVVPAEASAGRAPASRVLSSVVVVSAGADMSSLGSSGVRTVVVGIGPGAGLSSVLPELAAGKLILVRLGD